MKFQDYYDTPGVREVCHAVKQTEDILLQRHAIAIISDYFCRHGELDKNCYLIPAPQHSGNAEYTKEICNIVADVTKASVLDIVKCVPHKSVYELKTNGEEEKIHDVEYYRINRFPTKGSLVFVDNVISTGETFVKINELFDFKLIPMVYAVDFRKIRDTNILQLS